MTRKRAEKMGGSGEIALPREKTGKENEEQTHETALTRENGDKNNQEKTRKCAGKKGEKRGERAAARKNGERKRGQSTDRNTSCGALRFGYLGVGGSPPP